MTTSYNPLQTFTVGQVAEMLGVSVRTVRREIDAGMLDTIRVGRANIRVTARQLDDYLKRKENSA